MQVADLNQLVQRALQELDYLGKDFVCSGLWCKNTADAYKRFLIDENVDPHFADVQPVEDSHLPKTLFDYIFKTEEVGEIVDDEEVAADAAEPVIDLIAPGTSVVVNVGDGNWTPSEDDKARVTEMLKAAAERAAQSDKQGEQRQEDNEASGQEKQNASE